MIVSNLNYRKGVALFPYGLTPVPTTKGGAYESTPIVYIIIN